MEDDIRRCKPVRSNIEEAVEKEDTGQFKEYTEKERHQDMDCKAGGEHSPDLLRLSPARMKGQESLRRHHQCIDYEGQE